MTISEINNLTSKEEILLNDGTLMLFSHKYQTYQNIIDDKFTYCFLTLGKLNKVPVTKFYSKEQLSNIVSDYEGKLKN